jgi:multidrug transporter EmrE-like cation transporter
LGYFYIFGTILFTVYGQLIIKWQMAKVGPLPHAFSEKIFLLLKMVFNPWIFSAFLAAFVASICWMAAMTKFELSHAYPFTSLSFVFIILIGGLFFHETITLPKLLGVLLIMAGIIVGAQG